MGAARPPPLDGTRCSRSPTSPSATAPSAPSTARRSGPPRPPRGLPRAQRRRQDHHDALHLRARHARRGRSAGTARRSTRGPACGSATCPSSAASTPGCGSPSSSRTSASTTAVARRRADEGRRVARAVRARGPREVEARGPLARQPAARPARHGARPRPGAARPRRAVQRPRPDRHRDHGRRPPGARRAGVGVVFSSHQLDLVEEVCEDVVIISRGRVVAEGAIEEPRRASGRRHLDVEVAGTAARGSTASNHHRPRAPRRPREAARRRADRTSTRCSRRRARRARSSGSATSRRSSRSCSWRRRPSPTRPTAHLRGTR